MLSEELKKEIVGRILSVVSPTRIILFGSYATGEADEGSDIDLLVVVEEAKSRRELAVRVRKSLIDIDYGFDIIIATVKMMEKYTQVPGIIYEQANSKGVVLYAQRIQKRDRP